MLFKVPRTLTEEEIADIAPKTYFEGQPKFESISISLPARHAAALKFLAEQSLISKAFVVRFLIEDWFGEKNMHGIESELKKY